MKAFGSGVQATRKDRGVWSGWLQPWHPGATQGYWSRPIPGWVKNS